MLNISAGMSDFHLRYWKKYCSLSALISNVVELTGIDKMSDPVMLSIFGVHLLMFVQVDVTFMRDLRLFQCYHLVSM